MEQYLAINDLVIATSIGVHDWEKKIKQDLLVQIKIKVEVTEAMKSDNLSKTIDYTELAKKVVDIAHSKHFDLVEHLAFEIMNVLVHWRKVLAGNIQIHKKDVIPNAKGITFELNW